MKNRIVAVFWYRFFLTFLKKDCKGFLLLELLISFKGRINILYREKESLTRICRWQIGFYGFPRNPKESFQKIQTFCVTFTDFVDAGFTA